MHKDLEVANWKKNGTKHVPTGKKSGISEALRDYAKAYDAAWSSWEALQAFKQAHRDLLSAVNEAKSKFPKGKNEKLHVELKKVEDAAGNEATTFNTFVGRIAVKASLRDPKLETVLAGAMKFFHHENVWAFVHGMNRNRDFNALFQAHIAENAPKPIVANSTLMKTTRRTVQEQGNAFGDDLLPIYEELVDWVDSTVCRGHIDKTVKI